MFKQDAPCRFTGLSSFRVFIWLGHDGRCCRVSSELLKSIVSPCIILDNLPSLCIASSSPAVLDAHTSQCIPYRVLPRFPSQGLVSYACSMCRTRPLNKVQIALLAIIVGHPGTRSCLRSCALIHTIQSCSCRGRAEVQYDLEVLSWTASKLLGPRSRRVLTALQLR